MEEITTNYVLFRQKQYKYDCYYILIYASCIFFRSDVGLRLGMCSRYENGVCSEPCASRLGIVCSVNHTRQGF